MRSMLLGLLGSVSRYLIEVFRSSYEDGLWPLVMMARSWASRAEPVRF